MCGKFHWHGHTESGCRHFECWQHVRWCAFDRRCFIKSSCSSISSSALSIGFRSLMDNYPQLDSCAHVWVRVRVNGLAMEMRLNEYYSNDECKWHYLARGNNYFVYGATLKCKSADLGWKPYRIRMSTSSRDGSNFLQCIQICDFYFLEFFSLLECVAIAKMKFESMNI